jgi:hypothetical protein
MSGRLTLLTTSNSKCYLSFSLEGLHIIPTLRNDVSSWHYAGSQHNWVQVDRIQYQSLSPYFRVRQSQATFASRRICHLVFWVICGSTIASKFLNSIWFMLLELISADYLLCYRILGIQEQNTVLPSRRLGCTLCTPYRATYQCYIL